MRTASLLLIVFALAGLPRLAMAQTVVVEEPARPMITSGLKQLPWNFLGDEPSRYTRLPFKEDLNALVQQRLRSAEELGPYKALIEEVLRDPKRFNLEGKTGDGFDLNKNPQLRRLVESWIAKNSPASEGGKIDPARMQDWEEKLKKLTEPATPPTGSATREPGEAAGPASETSAPTEEPTPSVTEDLIRRAEESNLGDWLKESPAWQQAIKDLHDPPTLPDGMAGGWDLSKWVDSLEGLGERLPAAMPDGIADKLGSVLEPLRRVPLPDLSGLNLKLPSLNRLGGSSVPSLPHFAPSGGTMMVLLLALVGIGGWWLLRGKLGGKDAVQDISPTLVWSLPDDPLTRLAFVQSFDRLALASLGTPALPANHRTIAERWMMRIPTLAPLVVDLANQYEQARYRDDLNEMTPSQAEAVRIALQTLAEALRR